jgi:hypothetical protein
MEPKTFFRRRGKKLLVGAMLMKEKQVMLLVSVQLPKVINSGRGVELQLLGAHDYAPGLVRKQAHTVNAIDLVLHLLPASIRNTLTHPALPMDEEVAQDVECAQLVNRVRIISPRIPNAFEVLHVRVDLRAEPFLLKRRHVCRSAHSDSAI